MTKPPNILMVMADQMTALALKLYGNKVCRTPNIDALAKRGTVAEEFYCNFPLCSPSRASMLTGRLASKVESYDNASELGAGRPTLPYYLSAAGYRTMLSGKMHFVGPDQSHGYAERLTTDIYPTDFGWTPDWSREKPFAPTTLNMRSVVEAGSCKRSLQIDYDEEVAHQAVQALYDLGRDEKRGEKPFFLTVSFTHPHNPYVITQDLYDLYDDAEIDMPKVPSVPYAERDPHGQRLHWLFRQDEHVVQEHHIRAARRAYYAMCSYVDRLFGRLMQALDDMDLTEETIVIFTSDHGDMLGEKGLWYKWTLLEPSVRVPFVIAGPGIAAGRRMTTPVSHLDLLPTLVDAAGALDSVVAPLDGQSLWPALTSGAEPPARPVPAEMNAEGAVAPCLMIRDRRWKWIEAAGDPDQLYDLSRDPDEIENLAGRPGYEEIEAALRVELRRVWDPEQLAADVRASQKRRHFLHKVRLAAGFRPWDFQPFKDATQQYVRSGGSPAAVKGRARYPAVAPTPVDTPRNDGS